MRPDIVNLRQFYSSRLGRKVRGCLQRVARAHWPAHKGDVIVGIGYSTPMLQAIEHTGPARLLALMPAQQGAMYWPAQGENRSILGDEMRPPFAVNSVSRMVMLHALEHAERPDELLRIVWQQLAPGGQLLVVVPNRRGLWARYGATPFSAGTAHSAATLKALLDEAEFTVREISTALFVPPSTHPLWLHSAVLLEWLGRIMLPRSGGILVVEAEKQIFAGVGERAVNKQKAAAWSGVPA